MKNESVKEQIFSFLNRNPSVFHGGALQRMDFKTRRDGLATGDSIKRRLNELVEEKRISVSSNERNEAMFCAIPQFKTIQRVSFDELPPIKNSEGRWVGQARTITETVTV